MFKDLFIYFLFINLTLFISATSSAQDPYYINYSTEDGLPSPQTYSSFKDDLGYMWFTTDRGVVKYDGYSFKTYTTEEGLSSLVNFNFYNEEGNTFWVNGYDGTFSFWDGKKFSAFKYNWKLKSLSIQKSRWFNIIDINDEFISFILDYKNGLPDEYFRINRETGVLKTLALNKENFLKSNNISPYLRVKNKEYDINTIWESYDVEGNFWKLTRKGAYFYENGDLENEPKLFFKDIPLSSVYSNRNGSYWFTSLDKGLLYLPSIKIEKLFFDKNSNINFDGFKSKNGVLIAQVNLKGGQFLFLDKNYNYSFQNSIEFIQKKIVPKVLFTTKISKYSNRKIYLKTYTELSDKNILSISKNKLVIKNRNDLIYFEKKSKNFAAIQDSDDIIWIGTNNNLLKIEPNNNNYKSSKIPLINNDTIKIRVNDLALEKKGFWIGTLTKGLFYKGDKISNLEIKTFFGKSIQSLYKQNDSTLWAGTNKGLFKIHYELKSTKPKIKEIKSYSTNDGLHSNTINDIIYWNQKLFVATNNGINFFNPEENIKVKDIPQMVINNILVNGQVVDNIKGNLKFSYNKNNVKINYTGITFSKKINKNSFYRYRLNNEKWNYTDDRSVEYFFLPPNSYAFSIQCQNNDGIWSDLKTVHFTIPPHFTELISFRLGLLISILLVLFFIFRRRIKISREKITKELKYKESELATLRNQMNPHFVFNSLNTLQGYIIGGNVEQANEYIGDFATLMRKSLELSKKDKISLTEEVQFIENYLALEKHRYKEKFDYFIEVNANLKKKKVNIIPLIAQPLVENAVKHAFKKNQRLYKGEISIKYLLTQNNTITIEITDNGSGFDYNKLDSKDASHESMGIQIIKQRLELMNQKLNTKMFTLEYLKIEKGTKVVLTLLTID